MISPANRRAIVTATRFLRMRPPALHHKAPPAVQADIRHSIFEINHHSPATTQHSLFVTHTPIHDPHTHERPRILPRPAVASLGRRTPAAVSLDGARE